MAQTNCISCDNSIDGGANYCPFCGINLSDGTFLPYIEDESIEVHDAFLEGVYDDLERLNSALASLKNVPYDLNILKQACLSIHCIRTASEFLDYKMILRVAQKAENILHLLCKEKLQGTPEIITIILESVAILKVLTDDVKSGEIVERDIDSIMSNLTSIA